MGAVEIIMMSLSVGGTAAVVACLRAWSRRAHLRDRALMSAVSDVRGALIALPEPQRPRGGAVVDVEACDRINYDTDSGRWLQSVLRSARRDESAPTFPTENRGLQRLRLVPRLRPPERLDQGDLPVLYRERLLPLDHRRTLRRRVHGVHAHARAGACMAGLHPCNGWCVRS